MNITVNGKPQQIGQEMTIGTLLEKLKLDPTRVAVEHNLAVVSKEVFASTTLAEGDTLEIVQFVGGG
jgi:thiamine biosynthesis protein ThiS